MTDFLPPGRQDLVRLLCDRDDKRIGLALLVAVQANDAVGQRFDLCGTDARVLQLSKDSALEHVPADVLILEWPTYQELALSRCKKYRASMADIEFVIQFLEVLGPDHRHDDSGKPSIACADAARYGDDPFAG